MEDGKLAYRGNSTFFADNAPRGHTQSDVFATREQHPLELAITWKARS